MPRGTLHVIVGLLVDDGRGGLELRVDGGGTWRLDTGPLPRPPVDRRVRIEGVRSGFDLLDVVVIEPIE